MSWFHAVSQKKWWQQEVLLDPENHAHIQGCNPQIITGESFHGNTQIEVEAKRASHLIQHIYSLSHHNAWLIKC